MNAILSSQRNAAAGNHGCFIRSTFATMAVLTLGLSILTSGCGSDDDPAAEEPPTVPSTPMIASATIENFIADDPLKGDNGLPTSPAVPVKYGAVNMVADADGNAVQATDEFDLRYHAGKYYLYGPSFTCGSFNIAIGVDTGPLIPTNPNSVYRYCGLTIYESEDLMSWKLLGTQYLQDPLTGKHFYPKKPRVIYSKKTGLYNMWFFDGQVSAWTPENPSNYYIVQSKTPFGPWSAPKAPAHPPAGGIDMGINEGPDGAHWLVVSLRGLKVYKLNDELTDTLDVTEVKSTPDPTYNGITDILGGGVGISYQAGWWYLTGSGTCGNCVAAPFYYLKARDPRGPWMQPDTESTATPIPPTKLHDDFGQAQAKSTVMLPDGKGGTQIVVTGTRYRSSPTGAPGLAVSQPGDNNLALSGLYLTPLKSDASGRLVPLSITPSYQVPLAKPVPSTAPRSYQAALLIDRNMAVMQSWTLKEGESLAAVLPSVFQRTPDPSPLPSRTSPLQEPRVNAPLLAKLELPDGSVHSWSVDPRSVKWAPTKIPLPLAVEFKGSGRATLTLSTGATNGGYGVAVGKAGAVSEGVFQRVNNGVTAVNPDAEMLFSTAATAIAAPEIVSQPRSVTVKSGTREVGFLVEAKGLGLGYQWYKNGEIILSPNGYNESDTAALRLGAVTVQDAGEYTVRVFNQIGGVQSIPVTLTVVP